MFALEAQGLIFDDREQPPERQVCCFTSLCVLQGGAIVAGFQNGRAKHAPDGTVRLCRSQDGGRTWQLLTQVFETRIDGVAGSLAASEMVETRPGRLLLFATWFDRSDPARPLFDPVTEGILRSKQLMAVSTDDGASWSGWRELPTGDLSGCSLTGPVVTWNDGTLAVAFESFKEFDDPRPARHAAWLLVSRDEGESFAQPLLVAQDPRHRVYYWDQRLCAGQAPGQFTALFWTHDRQAGRDLPVHLCHGSLDGNATAGNPIQPTSLPGQIAAPLELSDGRLLAFVVDRQWPATMTLWCSADRGQTWPSEHRLIVHRHDETASLSQGRTNIDFAQYWEDMGKWSFGHPALRRLGDGRLLLAWYAGDPERMSLHWARVRVEPGATS